MRQAMSCSDEFPENWESSPAVLRETADLLWTEQGSSHQLMVSDNRGGCEKYPGYRTSTF